MEKVKFEKLTEEQINYDVYNGLNLINENLGESYINEGFNPLGDDFKLTEEFVIERYKNTLLEKEVNSPIFVSQGLKASQKAFENSSQNLTSCLDIINEMLSDYTLDKSRKKQYNKLKQYLECRIKLSSTFIEKLKTDKNALKMYKEILALDYSFAELFDDSYNELFDAQVAINAYLDFTKASSTEIKRKIEDKKLIEKARAIIEENIKQANIEKLQEQTNEQQPKYQEIYTSKPAAEDVKKSQEESNKKTQESEIER